MQSCDKKGLDDVETNVIDYRLQSVEQLERENEIGKTIFTERSRVVNLESITAVLLDPDLEAVRQLEKKVKDIIDYVELFDNPTKCEEYMRQIKYEGIIFIVSSLLVTSIISNIHDLQQLHAIYVYNQSKTKIKEDWIEKNCTKLGGLFIDSNELIQYLILNRSRLVKTLADDTEFLFKKPEIERTVIGKAFQYGLHPFVRLLLDHPINRNRGKEKLINYVKSYYKDNASEMKKILDFEEKYIPNDVILWYTKDSFIFRILNKALRLQNYEIIFLFRFFIIDLWNQIECENWKYFQVHSDFPIVCYRGQMMTKSEIENLKKLNLVTLNTFLSTSRNREVALMFTDQNQTSTKNILQSVLFVISIENWTKDCKYPLFADITSLSSFREEEETLFMAGAEFDITSVEFNQTKLLWIINLKLRQTPTWSFFEEKESHHASILECGLSLFEYNNHNSSSQVEQYFTAVLNEFSFSDRYVFACYTGLGLIALFSKNYDLALEYFHKCLDISKNNFEENFNLMSLVLCFIGNVYRERNDYNVALDWYEKALKSKFYCYLKYSLPVPYLFNDYPLFNIAFVYKLKGDVHQAWKTYENFIENSSNIDDFDEEITYSRICTVFTDNTNFDTNMEQSKMFINISFDYMIKHNSNAVFTAYKLLAIEYFNNKCYQLSLELFNLQRILLLNYGSNEYGQSALNYQWIAKVYLRMGHIDMGIKSYKEALERIVVYFSIYAEFTDILTCRDYEETLSFF
ncbi:unnamed protein product [Adineta ricciae]|uniref:Uncharacterized protein n=1 Tax=Adineta ricciae TaxID=249248 RepID=A0A815XY31_ADIRI|nr:unnamed protein product [Adineta ricciae]